MITLFKKKDENMAYQGWLKNVATNSDRTHVDYLLQGVRDRVSLTKEGFNLSKVKLGEGAIYALGPACNGRRYSINTKRSSKGMLACCGVRE